MPILSRATPRLLKTVGGQPRNENLKSLDEPEDVTAPPIDTDDDDETDEPHYDDPHYDSTDDEPGRGGITRSVFKAAPTSKSTRTTTRIGKSAVTTKDGSEGDIASSWRSVRSTRKRAVEDVEETDAEEPGGLSSKKRTKTVTSTNTGNLGSHIGDGFLVNGKAKAQKVTYGKRAVRATKTFDSSHDSTPRRKFERVKSLSEPVSPQQIRSSQAVIHDPVTSSPTQKSMAQRASKAGFTEQESSSLSDLDSDTFSDPPRPLKGRGRGQQQKQKQKLKQANHKPNKSTKIKLRKHSTEDDITQRPEFRMPEGFNDFAMKTNFADIDMSLHADAPADETGHLDPDKALCPMCDEPVDKPWLNEYSRGQRMSISRQAKFCRLHKKRSAKELWEMKGYPTVDWTLLEARIEKHRDYLESLINGKASHFGERLREKILAGKNRTLFKTDDYPVPGYYGLRGMSVMTESIVDTFSSLIRERAPIDRLISARGHTGYVQSVLVPELGVRLIREDLSIHDDGEARAVMRESQAVGVILNDEKGESLQMRSQPRVAHGGNDEVDDEGAAGNTGETGDERGDEGKLDLRIQRVDDSDSELSSLASLGDNEPGDARVGRFDGSDSDLASLAALGRLKKGPRASEREEVRHCDSDLSSLASLDEL